MEFEKLANETVHKRIPEISNLFLNFAEIYNSARPRLLNFCVPIRIWISVTSRMVRQIFRQIF